MEYSLQLLSVITNIQLNMYSGTSLFRSPAGLGKSDLTAEVTILLVSRFEFAADRPCDYVSDCRIGVGTRILCSA